MLARSPLMPDETRVPHVLVVDDTEGNRYAVSHVLRMAKMDVEETGSGADATRLIATSPRFDLIVLDIHLPDTTGFELVRVLKAAEETRRIPVMHISATAREAADRVTGLNAGADAYLTHPIEPDVLLATARALMRWGAAEAKLTKALEIAEEAQQQAEAANRAKAEFLAVMSHELRTPLNAISGYAELLDLGVRGPVSDEQRQYLDKIRTNQQRLLRLINDLLNFAKLDSGHVEYDCSPVMVGDLVRGLSDAIEPQLQSRGIRYIFEHCPPDLKVWADADKVQQILLNVLSNAIKFTPTGGVITVSCATDADHNRPCVAVRVRDTGLGIPADKLELIFDAFVQVDKRFVREQEGVGLGLSISRALARGMGGDMHATSEVGHGSTFTLTLPADRRRSLRIP